MRNGSGQAGGASKGRASDAQAAFAELLAASSQRGYYGTVTLSMNVQDGFIQQVRVTTERVVR
ncbi:hypothetical protein MalM25_34290 [Planctomycetes bacterium MalM25]|nr:hypothetical protein MalM25_34290 [Planctomycetes bacterium MalM25]